MSAEILSETAAAFSSSRWRWRAGDRDDVGGARQHPGECQLRRSGILGCGMSLQLLEQRQVTLQVFTLKPWHVAASVAGAQRRHIGDIAGQEPAAERAVSDKADAELLAQRQNLGFDIAVHSEYSICTAASGWVAWALRIVEAPASQIPI